jgi:hypothetical protein
MRIHNNYTDERDIINSPTGLRENHRLVINAWYVPGNVFLVWNYIKVSVLEISIFLFFIFFNFL